MVMKMGWLRRQDLMFYFSEQITVMSLSLSVCFACFMYGLWNFIRDESGHEKQMQLKSNVSICLCHMSAYFILGCKVRLLAQLRSGVVDVFDLGVTNINSLSLFIFLSSALLPHRVWS